MSNNGVLAWRGLKPLRILELLIIYWVGTDNGEDRPRWRISHCRARPLVLQAQ